MGVSIKWPSTPVRQLLVLFVIFHLFWLLFYVLSGSSFLKFGLWNIYLKQFIINSVGFVAFIVASFWIFPFFISKSRYIAMLLIALVVIIALGYLQYRLQDWDPAPFFKSEPRVVNSGMIPAKKNTIRAAMKLAQSSGAVVRSMLIILMYLLLGSGYAFMKDWVIKDRQARILEKEKLQAELTLLRYQLNPHFLFNIINDIYYLAIIQSDKTADSILKVSNLLRYVLNEKEDMVALDKEMDHLKEFIKLQQFRFPDQYIDLQIDMDSNIGHYQIAPLLLLSFVENAFKHGEPGSLEDPTHIELKLIDNKLTYTVINKINRNKSKDTTNGIGLNNLKRRLTLLYPNHHLLILNEEKEHFKAHLQIDLT